MRRYQNEIPPEPAPLWFMAVVLILLVTGVWFAVDRHQPSVCENSHSKQINSINERKSWKSTQ